MTAATDAKDARLASIMPGSPAAKAGLKPGDVVTQLNKKAIRDFPSLAVEIARHKPGETVKLTVRRDKKTITISVKLATRRR